MPSTKQHPRKAYAIPEAALQLIRRYTTLSLSPILNRHGIPSIGWGATSYYPGEPVGLDDEPFFMEEADSLLAFHCEGISIELRQLIGQDVQLSANQVAALISLVYDIGFGGDSNRGFSGSLLRRLINKSAPLADIKIQWMLWSSKGNNPSIDRRKEEAELFSL